MTSTPVHEPKPTFIDVDGRRIAIRHRGARPGRATVMFLPGYRSDMMGMKATAIDRDCAARGLGCLRLDYSGTGESAGAFADGTLELWLEEVLAVVDQAAPGGHIVIVGSSMGGWLAVLAALRRPQRIGALLGIAAAPDFTNWGYSAEEKAAIARDGRLEQFHPNGPGSSVTHRGFWQSGEMLLLLDAPIELAIPVRLLHGVDDSTVPVTVAMKLLEQIASSNAQLRLIKGGGHNLSEPHEIDAILSDLAQLVELVDLAEDAP